MAFIYRQLILTNIAFNKGRGFIKLLPFSGLDYFTNILTIKSVLIKMCFKPFLTTDDVSPSKRVAAEGVPIIIHLHMHTLQTSCRSYVPLSHIFPT